jgi:hypothetical protein
MVVLKRSWRPEMRKLRIETKHQIPRMKCFLLNRKPQNEASTPSREQEHIFRTVTEKAHQFMIRIFTLEVTFSFIEENLKAISASRAPKTRPFEQNGVWLANQKIRGGPSPKLVITCNRNWEMN